MNDNQCTGIKIRIGAAENGFIVSVNNLSGQKEMDHRSLVAGSRQAVMEIVEALVDDHLEREEQA